MKKSVYFVLLALSFNLYAGEGNSGGGGNDSGIVFQKLAADAVDEAAPLFNLDKGFLQSKVLNTKYIVVEEKLYVEIDGINQNSPAVNYPKLGMIKIQGAVWENIQDIRVKKALALHEILSLAELESTGVYTYSQPYLTSLGLPNCKNLCVWSPKSPGFKFDDAKSAFESGIRPDLEKLLDKKYFMTAFTTDPKFERPTIFYYGLRESYQKSGWPCGQEVNRRFFAFHFSRTEDYFEKKSFTIQLTGLGDCTLINDIYTGSNYDQGPYEVRQGDSTITFAYYGYRAEAKFLWQMRPESVANSTHNIQTYSSFQLDCRLVNLKSDKMICAVSVNLDEKDLDNLSNRSEPLKYDKEILKFNNKIIYYVGFDVE